MVDIILLNIVLTEHSGYHPPNHRPLRIVLGWCTGDITLLNIVLIG